MVRILMDPVLAAKLKVAVLLLEGVQVTQGRDGGIEAAMREVEQETRAAYEGHTPAEIPGCCAARRLYRSIGVDPTRMRPASEALLRRLLKGGEIPRINSAVDTGNIVSLRLLLPIGLYDADAIAGAVSLRLGLAGEGYDRIGSGWLNLEGRIGLFDAKGGFGNPTGDSRRTCVTVRTASILFVLFAPDDYSPHSLLDHAALTARVFRELAGAQERGRALLGDELLEVVLEPRSGGRVRDPGHD